MTQTKAGQAALNALLALNAAGFEAFWVGGCVRDILRGIVPHDYDICTNAHPEETQRVFSGYRTVLTGARHGTVLVLLNDVPLEITTYRLESGYSDNRHPDSVRFTNHLEDDLSRRDFTVNAMAYHPDKGVIDRFGGQKDLAEKVVRCVGTPEKRFSEDALRMLRAIRFECQLGFEMTSDTLKAIQKSREKIKQISRERIREELTKILLSSYPQAGAKRLNALLGEEIFGQTLQQTDELFGFIQQLPADEVLRYSAFLEEYRNPEAVFRSLRPSSEQLQQVSLLLKLIQQNFPENGYGARLFCNQAGEKFALKAALFYDQWQTINNGKADSAMQKQVQQVLLNGDACFLSQLAVNGSDLIKAGIKPGKDIGTALDILLDDVLRYPEHNQRELLLAEIKKRFSPT